jgi:putative DNA primase/helicase
MFDVAEIEELSPIDDATAAPDGLPAGFSVRTDGVYRQVEGDDGARWAWLCSPLRVLALPRDGAGRNWGRLIEVTDPDGRAHRWAMPMALLAGDGTELRATLLSMGLRLATDRGARSALSVLLANWTPSARARTADRLGWTDETCTAFVLGDGRVIGAKDVVFQTESALDAASAMHPQGDLAAWRETVSALCVGNPLMVFCASMALAGPLLEPLAIEGGGFHLRGASSRGKSTLQRAAVSVWGAPAFKRTWRATSNGLEGAAAACNSTLLVLDELGEIGAHEAGAVAYMIANGAGKSRANRSGGARASARWRVVFLSSGEISLADKLAEAGKREKAGQAVRLLDIPADGRPFGAFDYLHGARDGAAFADRVNAAAAATFGTAGPAFVELLIADLDAARAAIREAIADFEAAAAARFSLESEGQIARALKRFALVAAAGEAATAFDVTGWPPGVAREAALDVLGLWFSRRGGGQSLEAQSAIARTRAFIAAHGASRFEPFAGSDDIPSSAARIINRAGWRAPGWFFIASDCWRNEVHAGADPGRAARALEGAGFLERGDGRNLAQRVEVEGRPRAYAVRASILGAGDE